MANSLMDSNQKSTRSRARSGINIGQELYEKGKIFRHE
jgi:hypothetical protein